MNKNVIDYIDKIRNGILHDKISTDIPNYRLLCSALDIVSDAEDGIYSYINLKNENGRGLNYIYCYGIISLAETEAHAIKVIYKILLNKDLEIASIPDLDIVRLLRNKIFAHPVDLSQRHGKQGFGIVASYLSTFSFSPYSFENNDYQSGNELSLYEKVKNLASNKTNYNALIIDIKELIEKQQIILCKLLKEIETKYQL